jgi:glycine/D-amino acid oxidase-like deaminating enzyme
MVARIDVAIVGGGLCGSAVGYWCSRRGAQVAVVERQTLGGAGATTHSGGIVRAFDPVPTLMEWGLKGVRAWHGWDLSGPSPFTACGMLYLIAHSDAEAALEAARMYSSAEYPVIAMDERNLRSHFPQLQFETGRNVPKLGIYEPRGGFCDPRLASRIYGEAIRSHGGVILEHTHVQSMAFEKDAVALQTAHGRIDATIVILAAGAGARALLPSLPVTYKTIPLSRFRSRRALTMSLIDEVAGFYVRPESASHFLCGGGPQIEIPDPLDAPSFEQQLHAAHIAKLTGLLGSDVYDCVSGMMGVDCYTPDHLPLLGPSTDHERLYLATGFSGRGAKYLPAAAEHLSAQVCAHLTSLS